jgi:hypothetical protein
MHFSGFPENASQNVHVPPVVSDKKASNGCNGAKSEEANPSCSKQEQQR